MKSALLWRPQYSNVLSLLRLLPPAYRQEVCSCLVVPGGYQKVFSTRVHG